MKCVWFFFMFLNFSGVHQEPEVSVIRGLYQKAAEEEAAAKRILELTRKYESGTNSLLLGYKGAGHMMMAKHVINPFSKMSHFNKGKRIFSEAIAEDPENLELRFLRFAVQSEAPAFLGYKGHLEEDKELLVEGVGKIEDPELQLMIFEYLMASGEISNSEKEIIERNTH